MNSRAPNRQKKLSPRKPRSREDNDLIAWCDLTLAEQSKFTNAFHSDEARKARKKALQPIKDYEHEMVALIYRYMRLIQLAEGCKGIAPNSTLIEESQELAEDYRKDIQARLWLWASSGQWKKFHWFVSHAKAHCPMGLRLLEGCSPNPFPKPSQRLEAPKISNQTIGADLYLEAAILRNLAKTACMNLEDLLFYSRPPSVLGWMNPYLKEKHHQTGFVPVKLPTKKYLEKLALKEWRMLTGYAPKDPKCWFSRTIKKLGLAGLPKGGAAPLAEESLTDYGKELLDFCRQR